MRTWLSFRTPLRGVRVGVALPNPAVQVYRVSAIGAKVSHIGSAVMLVGLAIWLVASRDDEGRLNEWWWIVVWMVLSVRYMFKMSVVALFPPIEPPPPGQK
jgi:heme A synthase